MLRNRELACFTALLAVLSAVSIASGFLLSPAAGVLALLSAVAYAFSFFLFTRMRYQRIALLSERIDQVLHDADLYFDTMEEGELAILQSEIGKLVLRIRTQNEALLREKNRLADSLADVAHQLRTPLTSANIILTLLADESDGRQRKALLRDAERSFLQMEWLLDSLLKLSRLDAGIVLFQREQVSVEKLFSAALHPLLISLELRNITIKTAVPEGTAIFGDFPWLCEALGNILKNCMEQAGENGSIFLSCKDTLLYIELVIRDSGPGFSTEDLPHLFERFYRGKSANPDGYGIGLSLCRTIIVQQGGTITARNHPQGGAVFTIRFPK